MTDFIITPSTPLNSEVDTIIHVLLDGSTSMGKIRSETVDGLNAFMAKQESKPNSKTLVSVTVFKSAWSNLELNEVRSCVDVAEFQPITLTEYNPNGWTPLFDAITTVVPAVNRFAQSSSTPPAVLFVIITDGENNRSASTKRQVADMIKEMETDQKWTFIFLGANQDAFAEGGGMGIAAGNTVNYGVGNTVQAFAMAGAVAASYTSSNSALRSSNKLAKFATARGFSDAGVDNSKDLGS